MSCHGWLANMTDMKTWSVPKKESLIDFIISTPLCMTLVCSSVLEAVPAWASCGELTVASEASEEEEVTARLVDMKHKDDGEHCLHVHHLSHRVCSLWWSFLPLDFPPRHDWDIQL